MPKEIKDLKAFMGQLAEPMTQNENKEKTQRPKNSFKKTLTIKRNQKITKFKLRTKKYLYTFKTADGSVVKKILNNLPATVEKNEIKKRRTPK